MPSSKKVPKLETPGMHFPKIIKGLVRSDNNLRERERETENFADGRLLKVWQWGFLETEMDFIKFLSIIEGLELIKDVRKGYYHDMRNWGNDRPWCPYYEHQEMFLPVRNWEGNFEIIPEIDSPYHNWKVIAVATTSSWFESCHHTTRTDEFLNWLSHVEKAFWA